MGIDCIGVAFGVDVALFFFIRMVRLTQARLALTVLVCSDALHLLSWKMLVYTKVLRRGFFVVYVCAVVSEGFHTYFQGLRERVLCVEDVAERVIIATAFAQRTGFLRGYKIVSC